MLSKFMALDGKSISINIFCDMQESVTHVFCECGAVHDFWIDLRINDPTLRSSVFSVVTNFFVCYSIPIAIVRTGILFNYMKYINA